MVDLVTSEIPLPSHRPLIWFNIKAENQTI